jgi:serine/threonine protein kinase
LGRVEEAAGEYEAAIRFGATGPEPHFYLGLIHLKSHHVVEAVPRFEAALQISPEYQLARDALDAARNYLLADSAMATGAYQQAITGFTRYLSFYPGDAQVRQRLEQAQQSVAVADTVAGSGSSAMIAADSIVLVQQDSLSSADSLGFVILSAEDSSRREANITAPAEFEQPELSAGEDDVAFMPPPSQSTVDLRSDSSGPPAQGQDIVAATDSTSLPISASSTRLPYLLAAAGVLFILGGGYFLVTHRGRASAGGQPVGAAPSDSTETPRQLGRYEIHEEIGRGAMGVVYKAWDPRLERWVVLKTIRADRGPLVEAATEKLRQRLLREARAAARLTHPHIVTVYDVEEDDRNIFIAMEFIHGETLAEVLSRSGPLQPRRALRLLRQVVLALEYAHSHGVVHRDIKPSNIMVEPGDQVKVMDFGVAKLLSSKFTQTGELLGTASYMAPEQIDGRDPDGRADIFSAGVVLYECLTGELPFRGDTIPAILYEILHSEPQPISHHSPDLIATLDPILSRALAKDVDARFQTAAEFAQALDQAEENFQSEAILLIEVNSSGQLMERLGEKAARAIFSRFEQCATQAMSRHRPESLKSTGDGILAIFADASQAVAAAIDVYHTVRRSEPGPDGQHSIDLRGSIHVGETRTIENGDRISEDFVTSFLVLGITEKDRVRAPENETAAIPQGTRLLLTGAAHRTLGPRAELPVRFLGVFSPRNAISPQELFEVEWQKVPADHFIDGEMSMQKAAETG